MRQRSSLHGSASVSVIPVRTQPSITDALDISKADHSQKMTTNSATSQTEVSRSEVKGYGMGKWDSGHKASNPKEDWLLMQAISFTGRQEITIEEAKILWQHFNPETRRLYD